MKKNYQTNVGGQGKKGESHGGFNTFSGYFLNICQIVGKLRFSKKI